MTNSSERSEGSAAVDEPSTTRTRSVDRTLPTDRLTTKPSNLPIEARNVEPPDAIPDPFFLALGTLRISRSYDATPRPWRWRRALRRVIILGAMLAPVVASALFIYFVAMSMYMTESRFAVRGGAMAPPSAGGGGGISSFLSGGGSGISAIGIVDGYAVRDFLLSREAMHRVSQDIDLPALIARSGRDPLAALPAHPTDDQLYLQYKSIVSVKFNLIEQIVVMNVFAFSPFDSVKISQALLKAAEHFIDQMNHRALQDTLGVAQEDVTRAENRAATSRATVAQWRNQHAKVDPMSDTTMLTTLIGQLESQLATAQNNLDVALLAPQTPARKGMELQIKSLHQRIKELRDRMGGKGLTEVTQLAEYERLNAMQTFADASLASARQAFDDARATMLRQQKFLEVIATPLADNTVAYPNKPLIFGVSIVAGFALAFFGSVALGILRSVFR